MTATRLPVTRGAGPQAVTERASSSQAVLRELARKRTHPTQTRLNVTRRLSQRAPAPEAQPGRPAGLNVPARFLVSGGGGGT